MSRVVMHDEERAEGAVSRNCLPSIGVQFTSTVRIRPRSTLVPNVGRMQRDTLAQDRRGGVPELTELRHLALAPSLPIPVGPHRIKFS